MTMKNIDKQGHQILVDELKKAAQEIAAKHGLVIVSKGGKYTLDTGSVKMEFLVPNHDFQTDMGQSLGAEFDIGFGFRYKKRDYTVIGFDSNARKYKVIAQRDDNEEVGLTVAGVNIQYRINEEAARG